MSVVIDECAFVVIAPDASSTVEDDIGSVGVLAHLDCCLDEMRAQRAGRDLQAQTVTDDGVVVGDLALLLAAEHFAEFDAEDGHEDGASLGRHGKARVMRGQIDLAEEAVGGSKGGDPGRVPWARDPEVS